MFFSKSDSTGRSLELKEVPARIVSLVPSQTELLFDLGLEDQIVGVTNFCIHPSTARKDKRVVGGTKKIKISRVHELNPDLIIANKEENVKQEVDALAKDYPVWTTEVKTLEDSFQMIEDLGSMTHCLEKAKSIIFSIQKARERFIPWSTTISAVYLIWKNPYMSVGGDTFIHDMLEKVGFKNLYSSADRYPVISLEELSDLRPEYILLSSEPYPFKEKDVLELQNQLTESKVICVDGEMFSWYGSRIQQAFGYFQTLKSVINS